MAKVTRARALPPLENGYRLDEKTFHARYEAIARGRNAGITVK